jgi:hypothetical protein
MTAPSLTEQKRIPTCADSLRELLEFGLRPSDHPREIVEQAGIDQVVGSLKRRSRRRARGDQNDQHAPILDKIGDRKLGHRPPFFSLPGGRKPAQERGSVSSATSPATPSFSTTT